MTRAKHREQVLSIYPFTRGFAFVLLNGPEDLAECGTKEFRRGGKTADKNAIALDAAKKLIERLQPDTLALEVRDGARARRSPRVVRLQEMLQRFAQNQAIDVAMVTKAEVKSSFAVLGAATSMERAQLIGLYFRQLRFRLPRPRKPWMHEDERMRLFNATAVAMTVFCKAGEKYDV